MEELKWLAKPVEGTRVAATKRPESSQHSPLGRKQASQSFSTWSGWSLVLSGAHGEYCPFAQSESSPGPTVAP